jgi:hypothetical protein
MQAVLLFLLDFHQSGKVKTNFSKHAKYALLGKTFGWVTLCLMRSDQHEEACSVISQLLCQHDQNSGSISQRTRSVSQLTLLREVIDVCCKNHIAPLEEQCHNSKSVIFQEKLLKVLKYYNFLWVQWRHNCSLAASFANCVMTLYLLKVHLQTFLSIPVTQKCQISNCDSILLWVRCEAHNAMRCKTRSFLELQEMLHIITGLWKVNSMNFGLRIFFNNPMV